MHSALADISLAKIKARIAEGDCPTIKPYSVEALEELVVHFAERAPVAPVPLLRSGYSGPAVDRLHEPGPVAPVAVSVKGLESPRILDDHNLHGWEDQTQQFLNAHAERFTNELGSEIQLVAWTSPHIRSGHPRQAGGPLAVRYVLWGPRSHTFQTMTPMEAAKLVEHLQAALGSSIIPATKGGEEAEMKAALGAFATIFDACPWLEKMSDEEYLIGSVTLGDFRRARTLAALAQDTDGVAPADAFARWLEDGPRLAKAAGCYVGIRVTDKPENR